MKTPTKEKNVAIRHILNLIRCYSEGWERFAFYYVDSVEGIHVKGRIPSSVKNINEFLYALFREANGGEYKPNYLILREEMKRTRFDALTRHWKEAGNTGEEAGKFIKTEMENFIARFQE